MDENGQTVAGNAADATGKPAGASSTATSVIDKPTGAAGNTASASTGALPQDGALSRRELNKAKKAAKKARRQAQDAAEQAKSAAVREEKRRREAAFKQTIVGNQIVDEDGVPIRRYSLAERLLDNKKIGYGMAVGFLLLCLLALFFMPLITG
jgi:hypothetical protein